MEGSSRLSSGFGFGLGGGEVLVFCGLGFLFGCFFVLVFNGIIKLSTHKARLPCLQDLQCEKGRLPGTKLVLLCTGIVHQGCDIEWLMCCTLLLHLITP